MARFFKSKKVTPQSVKHLTLHISHLDSCGAGIAYDQGKTIFVKGALAGEEVVAYCYQSKGNIAHASIVKLLNSSPDRIQSQCVYYAKSDLIEQCRGCHLQHLTYDDQRAYKKNLTEKQFKQSDIEVLYAAPFHYRRRARLSFSDLKEGGVKLGFRQNKRVISVDDCVVLTEQLNQLLNGLKNCVEQLTQCYKIGHFELLSGDLECAILVHQIKPLSEADRQKFILLSQDQKCGLYFSLATGKDSITKASEIETVVDAKLSYQVLDNEIIFQPNHFVQVNSVVNQAMVQKALQWLDLKKEDVVLDLFCGVGNFSIALAKEVKWVIGVEGVADMVEQCHQNAVHNRTDNTSFYVADLNDSAVNPQWLSFIEDQCRIDSLKVTKVLLDPSREGAFELMKHLEKLMPELIVYVSCHPDSFENDIKQFQKYKLEQLCLIDMFPQTYHRELMALFKS